MSSSINSTSASARIVYETVKAVKQHPTASSCLEPVQAYHFYKSAREEELLAYRGVCRVFSMHYGSPLLLGNEESKTNGSESSGIPKAALRILEDLKDFWCIGDERATLEQEMASQDEMIRGVFASQVLRHREDFFDGVDDVDLDSVVFPSTSREKKTEDDGCVVHKPLKRARDEGSYSCNEDSASQYVSSGKPGSKKAQTHLLSSIAKIQREVTSAAKNLLYSSDPITQEQAAKILEEKKVELLQLKQELSE